LANLFPRSGETAKYRMDSQELKIQELKVRIEELRIRTGYYDKPTPKVNMESMPPLTALGQAQINVNMSEADRLKAQLLGKKL